MTILSLWWNSLDLERFFLYWIVAHTYCCSLHYELMAAFSQIDGLGQARCNGIVNALELRLFCTNPSKSVEFVAWISANQVNASSPPLPQEMGAVMASWSP